MKIFATILILLFAFTATVQQDTTKAKEPIKKITPEQLMKIHSNQMDSLLNKSKENKKSMPQKEDTQTKHQDQAAQKFKNFQRAYNARIAYEKNCLLKYDFPHWMNKNSSPPKPGETMKDYAIKYKTTVREMKDCETAANKTLQIIELSNQSNIINS